MLRLLFLPLRGTSWVPVVFRRLKIPLKGSSEEMRGHWQDSGFPAPLPPFVCQEFSEKDTSTSGDGGAEVEIKQIALRRWRWGLGGRGNNNSVVSKLPPASCFVLLFLGLEITEMCAKPRQSGNFCFSRLCVCFKNSICFSFSPCVFVALRMRSSHAARR